MDVHVCVLTCSSVCLSVCVCTQEESVLISWFLEKVNKGEQVGQLLPVVLAARGCVPEAMSAYQRLGNTQVCDTQHLKGPLHTMHCVRTHVFSVA